MPPKHNHHHHRMLRKLNSGVYPDRVVGPLGRLYDQDSFESVDEIRDHITRREPGDVKYLDLALTEFEVAKKEATPKRLLRLMCALKAIDFFEHEKHESVHGLNGTYGASATGEHALILPVPPHHFELLDEEITPGKVYVLAGHHVPHHLDYLNVAELPTRARKVEAEFAKTESITFEAYLDRDGRYTTRSEIVDLLDDLARINVKPLLRLILMPHRPHHETFELLPDGYQIETYE